MFKVDEAVVEIKIEGDRPDVCVTQGLSSARELPPGTRKMLVYHSSNCSEGFLPQFREGP
jgi:hypothetical protein